MSDEKSLYWLSQVGGWFGFVLLILFQNLMLKNIDIGIVKVLIINFVLGIGLSHTMRYVIISTGLLNARIYFLLPRLIALSAITGVAAAFIYGFVSDFFFSNVQQILVEPYGIIIDLIIPFMTVFLIWNILYFAAIFLKNYEREEVKNLRLTASMNEVELNNLRSQMNPHFIFNALNSIRALVDENPFQAKKSITQMSHILRSSLTSSKKRMVSLGEELKVVNDYLELEKIRYEERLRFEIDVNEEYYACSIPPLLIQTLVENGIKHGIANLPQGGKVKVDAYFIESGMLKITVTNSGVLTDSKNAGGSTGIGLDNSRRRLKLLYGQSASLKIFNLDQQVKCEILIPNERING